MKNWVYNSFEADAAFCAPGSPTVSVFREHPWPNNVIKIAGDGYAYLSYFTIENTSTDRKPSAQPFSPAAYEVHAQLIAHLAAGDGTDARANVDALWAAAGWTHDEWNYETLVAFWGNEGVVENLLTPVNTMFRHQCDVTGIETWQLHLLRVGSDGSSSDQIVKAWHDAFSTTYSVSTSFPYWHRTRFHTRELDIDFSEHIITDADQGRPSVTFCHQVHHC